MNPEDDPEARIRQLEQQSANHGAVELGANQQGGGTTPTAPLPPPVYGPPTTPVPPYGTPYQADPYGTPPFGVSFPQGPRKGPPVGLIFGVIAVFVVMVFGVIGIVVWNVSSSTEAIKSRPGGSTSAPGSGGTFGKPGTDGPSIPAPSIEPPVMPTMPGGGSETATPGGQLSIAGIDKNETIACNEAKINVSGVNNTVNLTGHCLSVTVSGVDNKVTVDNADTISASGFDNTVTYLGGDPQINNFGGSNTVQRG